MKTYRLLLVLALVPLAVRAERGGELGNAFIPFDSKIGHYSLEYSKDWRLNDLSETTSFAENKPGSAVPSFFSVQFDPAGPRSPAELLGRLKSLYPGVGWVPASAGGLSGFSGDNNGVRMMVLLRAPDDQLTIRMRSTGGDVSDSILARMLDSFRSE